MNGGAIGVGRKPGERGGDDGCEVVWDPDWVDFATATRTRGGGICTFIPGGGLDGKKV